MSREELRAWISEYYPALEAAQDELMRRELGISLNPETNELEDRLNLPLTEIMKIKGIGGRFYCRVYEEVVECNPNQSPSLKLLCRLNWEDLFKNYQVQKTRLFNYLVYELGIPPSFINCKQ